MKIEYGDTSADWSDFIVFLAEKLKKEEEYEEWKRGEKNEISF